MKEDDLAAKLLADLFTTAVAITALQLRHLSPEARSHVSEAAMNGTAHVELRIHLDTSETTLVLVPTDGSEPLGLTGTDASAG